MKSLLTLTTLALSGCGAQYEAEQMRMRTPAYQACAYQAKVATPRTNSILADLYREEELTEMCMRNKSASR